MSRFNSFKTLYILPAALIQTMKTGYVCLSKVESLNSFAVLLEQVLMQLGTLQIR